MKHTAGLVARKNYRADKDAEAVKLMRLAGAIPIATTNVSELAMWWESTNCIYGTSKNPYNTRWLWYSLLIHSSTFNRQWTITAEKFWSFINKIILTNWFYSTDFEILSCSSSVFKMWAGYNLRVKLKEIYLQAHRRWFFRWRRMSARGGWLAVWDRFGYRRINPHAMLLQRDLRTQAIQRYKILKNIYFKRYFVNIFRSIAMNDFGLFFTFGSMRNYTGVSVLIKFRWVHYESK